MDGRTAPEDPTNVLANLVWTIEVFLTNLTTRARVRAW